MTSVLIVFALCSSSSVKNGNVLFASITHPIPPVFGPSSLSNKRLLSCIGGKC